MIKFVKGRELRAAAKWLVRTAAGAHSGKLTGMGPRRRSSRRALAVFCHRQPAAGAP